MIKYTSILTICLLITNSLIAQDIMLVAGYKTVSYMAEDLQLGNNRIAFREQATGTMYSFHVAGLIRLAFRDEGRVADIEIAALKLDTIFCNVLAIKSGEVEYYLPSQQKIIKVNTERVFGIFFNDSIAWANVAKHQMRFFTRHSIKEEPLILTDIFGRDRPVTDFGIKENQLEVTFIYAGNPIQSYLPLSNVSELSRTDKIEIESKKADRGYLIRSNGSFMDAGNFVFSKDTIGYQLVINQVISNFKTPKSNLAGITFIDFSQIDDRITGGSEHFSRFNNGPENKKIIDFSFGAGYLLGRAPKNASSELKKYINEMRLGFTYQGSVTFMISKFNGLGIKFNGFSTSNSMQSLAEDNVNYSFLGLNLSGLSPLPGNSGYFNYGFGVGPVFMVNNAKAIGQSFKVTGQTIALYLSLGFDFNLAENLYLNIQSGMLYGYLRNFKINGSEMDIDEAESLNRLDGKIGLKFYF